MKVQFKLNDQFTFELEGNTTKDIFKRVAEVTDVFDNPPSNGGKPRYVVRKVSKDKKNYEYFEAVDQKTRGRLAYGVYEDGSGLFPKRFDKDKKEWIENNGYVVYKPEDNKEE